MFSDQVGSDWISVFLVRISSIDTQTKLFSARNNVVTKRGDKQVDNSCLFTTIRDCNLWATDSYVVGKEQQTSPIFVKIHEEE